MKYKIIVSLILLVVLGLAAVVFSDDNRGPSLQPHQSTPSAPADDNAMKNLKIN